MPESQPTNTAVDRAGATLRAAATGQSVDPDIVEAARETVEVFRRRFLIPHLDVREELSGLAAAHLPHGAAVTARWKRYDRIVDKLVRLPTLRLSQMQDVGGCRLVARPPASDLSAVGEVVAARWPVVAYDDYVARPRRTGYRARHLVVRHGGLAIEVQLRTFLQDQWAETFETVHRNSDIDSREPEIQAAVASLLRGLSDLMAGYQAGTLDAEEAMREVLDLFAERGPALNALHWHAPPSLPRLDR